MIYTQIMADLYEAPAYLINLVRRPNRLAAEVDAIHDAGYRHVFRFAAVDGQGQDARARAIRAQPAVGVIDQVIPELLERVRWQFGRTRVTSEACSPIGRKSRGKARRTALFGSTRGTGIGVRE
jgi:hypothetical protein